MKQNKLAELVQLVKELQEWRDGYGLYQSGQKESFNAILAKASQIAEPTVDVCQEVTREMAIADLVKENRRLKEIVNSKPPVNDMAGLVETKLGQGELEFDGVESSWHVPTNWRSDGFKCCGKYGELIFRYKKEN